jgi:tetratricopeptide (TPR) repeat protein
MVLVNVHRAIGYERERRGDTSGGVQSFRTALAMARALVDEKPDDLEARTFLARSYESVSDGLVRSGDLDGALQSFQAALKLRQEAAARDPGNAVARRNVAVLHMDLGDVQRDRGHPQEALQSYRQALAIHDALVAADPGNIQSVDDRFVSYAQMCLLAVMTESVADGRDVCRRALEDAGRVARDPASALGQERLGNAQVNLGRYRLLAGDRGAAVEHLRAGVGVYEKLSAAAPESSDGKAQLAEARMYLGQALLAAGRAAEARAAYQQVLSAVEPLAAADPLDAAMQHLLAAGYEHMGAAQGSACGPARAYYDQALAVWSGLRAKGQLKGRDAPRAERVARAVAACAG